MLRLTCHDGNTQQKEKIVKKGIFMYTHYFSFFFLLSGSSNCSRHSNPEILKFIHFLNIYTVFIKNKKEKTKRLVQNFYNTTT